MQRLDPIESLERVYTVHDFYDGPLRGVAAFRGVPHVYFAVNPWCPETEDLFELKPISVAEFDLLLEDWEIWRRWKTAYDAGTVSIETHPALPEDAARNLEIREAVDALLDFHSDDSVVLATAEFMSGFTELTWVRWTPGPA